MGLIKLDIFYKKIHIFLRKPIIWQDIPWYSEKNS